MIRLLLNYGLQDFGQIKKYRFQLFIAEVEDLEMSTPLYTKILKILS